MKKKYVEPSWEEELDDDEINIILTEEEIIVLHNFMKKLMATRKTKIEEFSTQCKYCGKDISMRNFGFGWRPYGIKKGKPHKCKEGLEFYKEQHKNDNDT